MSADVAAWARDLEAPAEERDAALAEAARIIGDWGLAMPPGAPLALDFGLRAFRRTGEIEYWIVNDTEHGYCGKLLFLFDGQGCPRHRHRMKDETFFVVRGQVRMEMEGREMTLAPGDTLRMPPGTAHSFRADGGPALILEVSLPSVPGDNRFDDTRIGRDGVL